MHIPLINFVTNPFCQLVTSSRGIVSTFDFADESSDYRHPRVTVSGYVTPFVPFARSSWCWSRSHRSHVSIYLTLRRRRRRVWSVGEHVDVERSAARPTVPHYGFLGRRFSPDEARGGTPPVAAFMRGRNWHTGAYSEGALWDAPAFGELKRTVLADLIIRNLNGPHRARYATGRVFTSEEKERDGGGKRVSQFYV